jgi:hypothetical protein
MHPLHRRRYRRSGAEEDARTRRYVHASMIFVEGTREEDEDEDEEEDDATKDLN